LYYISKGYGLVNFDGKLLFRILGMILHQNSKNYPQMKCTFSFKYVL